MATDEVRRVACIGTGLIGGGWAAFFLARGLAVTAWDPGEGAVERLHRQIDRAWPLLERIGLAPGASRRRLSVAATPAAAAEADYIIESAPERLEAKVALLAELDSVARPDVIIASSTSGLLPSELQSGCRRPGRVIVAHPFNPAYLMPLVEIVGGAATDPAALDRAEAFLRGHGKVVLRLDREVPGFVANRMQAALWREALHMVAAGEATVEQIDAALANGPGLRWALMGPFLAAHLAGGDGGIAHMLRHFGGLAAKPWTRLPAPAAGEELFGTLIADTEREAGGRSIAELERRRDDALVEIIAAARRFAAG